MSNKAKDKLIEYLQRLTMCGCTETTEYGRLAEIYGLLESEPEEHLEAGEFTKDFKEWWKFQDRFRQNNLLSEYAARDAWNYQQKIIDRQAEELQAKDEALLRIKDWAEAYPLEVFPEITKDEWHIIAEVLKKHNISLDRISADNMRHVVEGVKCIAEQALKGGE